MGRMGRGKIISVGVIGIMILAGAFAFAAEEAAKPPKPYAVGDKIESLTVTNLDGKQETLKFDSKITALSFFNTACSACRAELSLLNGLMMQEKGFRVVAVCVDVAGAESAKRFIEQTKFKFDYVLDTDFKIASRFGFSYTPGLALVKEGGEVTFLKGGYMNKDEETIVQKVMGK